MTEQTHSRRSAGYQFMLVAILSINFGIVFFDRNALNFLMPFVQPELNLSNFQVGMFSSALSLSWALSAFAIGFISDKLGSRKPLLIIATVCFSLCSFLSGMATSFLLLLGARLLMGAAEGGVMPITQSIIAAEVSPKNRGLAMGVSQNFGSNLLGAFAAPIALVAFAETFGWREAFYLAGVPGLISALLIWFLVDEVKPIKETQKENAKKTSLADVLKERNVLLCALIGTLLVAYLVICWTFMPLYLTQVRGFGPDSMSWLMGTLGLSAAVGSIAVSYASDLIGRKPIMVALPIIGAIIPICAIYFDGSVWALAAIFFFGWALIGVFPLFMGTIPSESVDARHLATVLGVCMGTPEVLGGVLGPSFAGQAADIWGQEMPLWIMVGLTLISGVLGLALRETAPRALARREKQQQQKMAV